MAKLPPTQPSLTTTAQWVHHQLENLKPRLAFNPGFTSRQAAAWQGRVRAKLRELLHIPGTVPKAPAARLLLDEARDGYRLQRWELYPQPDYALQFLLLIPNNASDQFPAPAVLCLPGTDHPKEHLAGEPFSTWTKPVDPREAMALQLVKAGFVTLAMDNPATAQAADPAMNHWMRHSLHLIWMGDSYEAFSVREKLLALAFLRTQGFVDHGRIAACGHSLGAKPALISALLDPCVKAVVFNSALIPFKTYMLRMNLAPVAPWQIVPGMIQWFDYPDLMAALAPRPLLITEGARTADLKPIKKSYSLQGKPANLKLTFMPNFQSPSQRTLDAAPVPDGIDGPTFSRYHNFDDDHYFKQEAAVPWLIKHLTPSARKLPCS
jgi:hypothetical protein